ncbi:MAG: hypothetical protein O3B01_30960 [Planctomycetota bacterium]|nr:hypothetical protein [Planctomycetota bacterium]
MPSVIWTEVIFTAAWDNTLSFTHIADRFYAEGISPASPRLPLAAMS